MSSELLDELARAHEISPGLRQALEALLRRVSGDRASVMSTVMEPASASVTLHEPDIHGADAPSVGARPHTQSKGPSEDGGPLLLTQIGAPDRSGARYEDLGLLGTGGMGEVRRVRDLDLNRTMAMKIIRSDVMSRPRVLARFLEEAQCSAQLQHPGIVPVHEVGTLPDGRVYFTMAEIRGRTLSEVITELHWASQGDRWQTSVTGWTIRGLLDAFHRACEAVAYAHNRGVVHRDLKPDNIMLGRHGEVLVVDWGLAKIRGATVEPAEEAAESVRTHRSDNHSLRTRMGAVAGTPAYMPPEQARGAIDQIDARSDVYALGAILYEILSGRPPYQGATGQEVLSKVLLGPPDPPGRVVSAGVSLSFDFDDDPAPQQAPAGPPLPEELVTACSRAMARMPGERFDHAGAFADAIGSWLDGARRREQALEVVGRAEDRGPRAAALRARAAALQADADALLTDVAGWQPEADKAPGWAKADQAASLERDAGLLELEQEQLLAAALTHAPGLPEAHAALAQRYRRLHEAREAQRADTTRLELLLRGHAAALPDDHPARAGHVAYLKGDGALSLVTDPPGAEVLLHRYELRNRRLVAVFERSLGHTPLSAVPLPMGSYLCVLRHPDRASVRYPVHIARGAHWAGVPPGASSPHPVWLPRAADLSSEDCYVPAGWFQAGGDPEAADALSARRVWVPGFAMARTPVTNQAYLAFLDDLVAGGREAEALRYAPRERTGTPGELGALIYGYAGGRFALRPDAEGDVWQPDWPVLMVTWAAARAYAAWAAARTGRPWGLPHELAWEKAARGVDGRFYPWGDCFDPSWCCSRHSHRGRMLPAEVGRYAVDESVYGVRDLAGNLKEWTGTGFTADGPAIDGGRVRVAVGATAPAAPEVAYLVVRGGSWALGSPASSRGASRQRYSPGDRYLDLGIRLARPLGSGAPGVGPGSGGVDDVDQVGLGGEPDLGEVEGPVDH